MPRQETIDYEEQYKDSTVFFSSFAFTNTGLIKSQTTLKIDTYTLMTVPWQFGMRRSVLLGFLSADEIGFFQRYKGSAASLTLAIQRPDANQPFKIFSRCQVAGLGQMKDRDGVGMIVIDWKPLPPALAEILGEYLSLLDRLKVEQDDYRNKVVSINPENARKLGYNNYAVLAKGSEKHKIALFSLGANRLEFLMPMAAPEQKAGDKAVFEMYFLKYRFAVAGEIEASSRLPTGVQRCKATIAFSPELVHILEEYFTSRS